MKAKALASIVRPAMLALVRLILPKAGNFCPKNFASVYMQTPRINWRP